ncbi:hypothetical protein CfE428DRAFT_5160 [Chthoniobacter flavus Ellin428]|uniref:von Willebrand factor type A n=1 Tax=Chthoniobacter flavus Ellin428 TaxID=497964 RepID=B4D8C0_9BACT|nr:VWA domain-containing protein [Chthoniobacter flavus]EDY17313.1 hypothetical protein CfE428DRAFT_5160 [Chthoniobacter flavus Ellin428]TCO90116.1 von Willebrand factor type A domain-containing protein [Chthoniobacter flavus]
MLPAFSSLGNAWLFALLVPLIAFYFLKLKRPRVAIPSLVLWRQVLNDQRVNSPFQRFKRNLLLLLQILILTLLALAAMQPFLRREAARAHRLPVLIDVSASMAALDKPHGKSRLDEVKQRLRERIDALLLDQELCLVAFGKTARRLTAFTNNHRELREALDALTVEDVPSDIEEALRLTQALGRTEPFDKVLLLSDGNLPTQANFELPFAIDFQKTPPAGPNFGVTAFSARRAPGGHWQVFVQLAGSANAPSTTGALELRQGDKVIAHEDVSLTKGSAPRLTFDLAGGPGAVLEARLKLNDFDSLGADDAAWLTLPASRPLAIFVPENLAGYRHALAALEDVNVFPQADAPTPAAFDLVISDHEEDLAKPARVKCVVGIVPADARALVTVEHKNAQAIDWRRDSSLLQHVSLRDVVFMDEPVDSSATAEDSLAQLGYETLAQGEHGPLILQKRTGEALLISLLFHTDRSTLPYRVGFPILVANLVQTALHESGLAEAEAGHTGVLSADGFVANASCTITGPADFRRTVQADAQGRLTGIPAPRAGEYSITASGGTPQSVGANLLSASETSLAAVDQLQFNDQLTVAAVTAPAKSDRALWWAIALAAFLALLVEWWWFQRPARTV